MIRYFESEREYIYLVGDTNLMTSNGEFLVVRGELGKTGSAKKSFAGVGWVENYMQLHSQAYTNNGFVAKDAPKETLVEGTDYVFLTVDDYAQRALDDQDQIAAFADELIDSQKKPKDVVKIVSGLLDKWGMGPDMVNLIAVIATLPSAKKPLAELDAKYGFVEKIRQNQTDYENLFYKLQEIIGGRYVDDLHGLPTKANVKKYAKKIALPLEAFGYGIFYEGLKTMFHCFHNDGVAGIGLDMYREDTKFSQDDFPYYDGIENDDAAFWDRLNMEDCL